jgi:hypothetical protein
MNSCSHCHVKNASNICSGCYDSFYCNTNCQTQDWTSHQQECIGKRYGKVHKVMKEFKQGKLKTRDGRVVTDRDQAIAIALSEQRKESVY